METAVTSPENLFKSYAICQLLKIQVTPVDLFATLKWSYIFIYCEF